MNELWIRRGGLLLAAACMVLIALSGGDDLSLAVLATGFSYFFLFGAPQFFLRRRTTVEPWLGGLALVQLACMVTIGACLPRGSARGPACVTTYDYATGTIAKQECSSPSDSGWTVPIVHLFTGANARSNHPWLALTLTAVVVGCLGALALWVAVAKHLRRDDWRDLDPNANPAAASWATLDNGGAPSTIRPTTRTAAITDAVRTPRRAHRITDSS